jgi:hypothetical protein
VAEHVRGCAACTAAVASLRSAAATVRAGAPDLVEPPAGVWDAVVAELDDEPAHATAPAPGASALGASAPEASDDLARARAARTGRRRVPWAWVAGAAAAGLVVGAVGAGLVIAEREPAPVVVARTTLDTLDTKQARGTADVVRQQGQLDLDLDTAALDPGSGYFEVWLINKDLKRMVSVGVLRPQEGHQRFAIDQALIDQGYVIVDVSREGFDDRPEHSGDSVVRGTLAL